MWSLENSWATEKISNIVEVGSIKTVYIGTTFPQEVGALWQSVK